MSQRDEAHTQLTTRELEAMLAEAHRRGAIDALRSVYETVACAMERQDGPEFATLDMVLTWLMDVRARYEKPEEAK